MLWLKMLWDNRRVIGGILAVVLVVGLGWYYIHVVPTQLAEAREENRRLAEVVKQAELDRKVLDNIAQRKGQIDAATHFQISTIRARPMPRRGVIVVGGMPLQTVR